MPDTTRYHTTPHRHHPDTGIHGNLTKKWYFYKGKPDLPEGVAQLRIFGGSVYPELSQDVCKLLGINEGKIDLGRYVPVLLCVSFTCTANNRDALSLIVLSTTLRNYKTLVLT